MNHSDVRKSMADYLEGDLALHRRALFDAHLDECVDCAREIAEMRHTIALLRGLPDPEPPPHLVDDVMRRIRTEGAESGWLGRLRALTTAALAPRVLAPVSAAMLVAGLILGADQVREVIEAEGGPTAGLQQLAGQLVPMGGPGGRSPNEVASNRPVPNAGEPQIFVRRLPREVSTFEPVIEIEPSTPGQELVARNEILIDRSSPPMHFGGWPLRSATADPATQVSIASRGAPGPDRRLGPDPSVDEGAAISSSRRWPSADQWLDHVQRHPAEFADQMATRTLAEQEHWIDSLARRAFEEERLDAVVAALRSSESRTARILADDFAAAGARFARTYTTAAPGSD